MEGGCNIRWFVLDKYNTPQNSNFNIKMESILSGDYLVINELIKLKCTKTHLNNFLTCMLEGKKSIQQKMTEIRIF
jgi:hypothetical protein